MTYLFPNILLQCFCYLQGKSQLWPASPLEITSKQETQILNLCGEFSETGANNKILYSASAVETCMKLMFHMNWDCQEGFDSAVWQFLKLHLCWTGFYCNVPAVYALYQFKSKKVLRWVWAIRHLSSGLLWFIAKFKSNMRATKVNTCMLREGSQWEIYRSAILCIALKKNPYSLLSGILICKNIWLLLSLFLAVDKYWLWSKAHLIYKDEVLAPSDGLNQQLLQIQQTSKKSVLVELLPVISIYQYKI